MKEKIGSRFAMTSDAEIPGEHAEEYVELESTPRAEGHTKIMVRPFMIEEFEDIKQILDALREGYTIALVNIKPLKDKDLVELKRVINKLKKTCDAIDGDIAGFGEGWIVATPNFASIYRSTQTAEVKEAPEAQPTE